MINESCHLSSKVEIMVSICWIASCKYKKHAIFLSCFGDFSDSSYFLPGLFRILGWVWGAVLGISAVSATFFCFFPAFWAGFGWIWGAVFGIYAISATFPAFFRIFWLGLGCCFGDFCIFSYFFLFFSGFLAGFLGAVWGIYAVSATFSCSFPDFWVLFGKFMRFQLHKARLLCYQPMAIVHYDNWKIQHFLNKKT